MSDVPTKLHYFDRRPDDVITAERVRAYQHGDRDRWVLTELLKHPGVSSSARSVIEACLEAP